MNQGKTNHIRLLMADDDADDLELMTSAFRDAGFSAPIQTFTDGTQLLEYLLSDKGKSAIVVMLDLNMPKLDGKMVLAKIRRHPELAHLSVIVYSTSNAPEDILDAYQLGCNAYVVKPNCYNEIRKIATGIRNLWLGAAGLMKLHLSTTQL